MSREGFFIRDRDDTDFHHAGILRGKERWYFSNRTGNSFCYSMKSTGLLDGPYSIRIAPKELVEW